MHRGQLFPRVGFVVTNLSAKPEGVLFDAVVGSFILTVVPDPLKELQEVKRVRKPGGKLLLEFTRSGNQLVAFLQDLVAPLTRAVYRVQVNRDIVMAVERSGFRIITVKEVGDGIVKIIQAARHWRER